MAATLENGSHEPARQESDSKKDTTKDVSPKKGKQTSKRGSNYHQIHAKPLPLEVYPLPAFIPHNPISILRIAFSLLFHMVRRPTSHSLVHATYFSLDTQSIHVTDPRSIRALWEQGFWGSGSLSRSEPRWLDLQRRKLGLEVKETSEEVTRQRREDRQQFKLARARAQREAIEQQLREEGKIDAETNLDDLVEDGSVTESPRGTFYPADAGVPLAADMPSADQSDLGQLERSIESAHISPPEEIEDQEHLQLTLEEAFFLAYTLGSIIVSLGDITLTTSDLLRLCCAKISFPLPQATEAQLQLVPSLRNHPIEPDNRFMLQYVVFHHFRSLGWVVRSGIKFSCDYLLYLRGPAFHHAEFAVMILPAYSHPYWSESADRIAECKKKEGRDWWWLHRLHRVQTGAKKTLVLVYIEVPPPWDEEYRGSEVDIGNVLKRYNVREFIWKRWSVNRSK